MNRLPEIIRWGAVWLCLWAVPLSSLAQQVVEVRNGDHPTFSRIVFDWLETVSYSANISGDRLEIIFDKVGRPNWNSLRNEPLVYMADPEYHIEGEQLFVTLTVTKPGQLKHFRTGTGIAFDIIGGLPAPTRSPVAEIVPEIVEAVAQPLETIKNIETIKQDNLPLSGDPDLVTLAVQRTQNNIRLSYPWRKNTRSAVFIRHSHLWVVFDDKKRVDQSALDRYLGQRLLSGRQIDHPSMTVLQYEIIPGQKVKAQRIGTAWQVDLGNTPTTPALSIQSSHQRIAGKGGENYFFATGEVGGILIFDDPVIGDRLGIIPVMESSQAVLKAQKFAEFEVLPTAQGIAVQFIADNLNILKHPSGVSVATTGGLALSRSQLSSQLGLFGEPDQGAGKKLVDFVLWKKGPLEDKPGGDDYHENKHELLYMLSNSTDTDRSEIRWLLARFYLANGRTREALGVLNVMLDDDSKLKESPEFRTVLGVTNILMHRYEEGARLLLHKALLAERDVLLWRAVANSALGQHKAAFESYQKGADILPLHDHDSQIRFMFAAVRSAYALGDENFVEFGLSSLRNMPLSRPQLTELDYWRAVLDRDKGDLLKAEETLQDIVKAGERQTAAWATFDLINMGVENKKIDATEAVDQLEKLRFSWRGDDFELDLLSRLGDMYVAQNDFNTGLQTLRQAVTFFKESEKTADLARQMNDIYSDLFLKGGARVLAPVKAVALYSEFRELIPLGKDGDNMTRRLVDRLVSLDLLEEAAGLLNHQIKFRLKGSAQSVVASRLAMIYLLDSKSQSALDILQATRSSQIPDDIQDRRRMIEARTLIELDRYEEAEVMLEDYKTPEADDLRTDIYWQSEDWNKFIRHSNRMLGNRYAQARDFTPEERLSVLRLSVAYVINDDKAGVKILRDRYKTHMDDGLYADTFEVITAERQLTDQNVRRLTRSIASVSQLESFMESYKAEFASDLAQN